MESTHTLNYYSSSVAHEQDLLELAKDLGIDIPHHILRILVKLLEEGIHPTALTKLCKDLCKNTFTEKKSSVKSSE